MQRGNRRAPGGHKNCAEIASRFSRLLSVTNFASINVRYLRAFKGVRADDSSSDIFTALIAC
jgi:hypothetical protein